MEPEVYRDLAGGYVGYHLRDEEGVELGPVFLVGAVVANFVLKGLDASDANAEYHADAVFVCRIQVHAAVVDCLDGRDEGQLGVAVHLAGFLAVYVVVHVEPLHLAGKVGLELGSVK